MHQLFFAAVVLFVGCPPQMADTDRGTDAPEAPDTAGTEAIDPDTDSESSVVDLDQDGAVASIDCDDREPLAFPGAVEVWDGIDNDCDGRVDGRGEFQGTMSLQATAIVEGQTQRRTVDCSVLLTRQTVVLAFDILCEVPSDDALAQQLLGDELVIAPVDNVAIDGRWSGQTEVTSDAGWTASGTGSAVWSQDLMQVALTIQLESASLRLSGVSDLTVMQGDER